MAFQQQIYNNMPIGIEGEYADDSPRRDTPFILLANETQTGAQATATLAFTANPSDGDTLTISSIVYRFEATPSQANDIKIGSTLANTLTSLANAINGEGEPDVDYYAGTTALANILTAAVSGSDVTLTAVNAGLEGNVIALASSSNNVVVTAFAGGAAGDAVLPRFACAFTYGKENGTAVIGGEGVFAGVLVNPKMYINHLNFNPTLNLPNATQGSLCTFGHVFIKSSSAYAPGDVAAYDKTTGAISAYINAAAVPASAVLIPNAQFIKYAGNAGTVGVLELGN